MNYTNCPKCHLENIYQDRDLWVCPDCSHEWTATNSAETVLESENSNNDSVIKDVNGVILANGDSVVVIKDLPIKGSSNTVKSGTKVRNIRLKDADDGHNISCKIDGIGSLNLKSEFVKKA